MVFCYHHFLTTLTPAQIRDGWMTHINSWIWVSNARVRELFDRGILPLASSLLAANELAIQIDAQLITEIFGALALRVCRIKHLKWQIYRF
jgi:hypothetical protein